ncbi:Uncharacterized protein M6B38_227275 [Iris pallida]|uniref:Uncharacterized protein n=1 Tax=Iris pallida TaxID=29817 RepID=A0AAX6DTL8_IRIPA|nr:Uncharacterized protein M6B38_227275 [Iris pallida]
MSAAGDAKDSRNGLKSSFGQLNVPYLPPHSLRPFPFARGPYPSHYQDQLAAAASYQARDVYILVSN